MKERLLNMNLDCYDLREIPIYNAIKASLIERAYKGDLTVWERDFGDINEDGEFMEGIHVDKIKKFLEIANSLVNLTALIDAGSNTPSLFSYLGDDNIVRLNYFPGYEGYLVSVSSLNPEHVAYIENAFSDCSSKLEKLEKDEYENDGKAAVVYEDSHGFQFKYLPSLASSKLMEGNYQQESVDKFYNIIENIEAEEPAGRLVILRGKPGTGKTHFIRGLCASIPNAFFVIIPSFLIDKIASPKMIGLFINIREHFDNDEPIVFILEDADAALTKREDENLGTRSHVESLLNMTNGIIGDSLNIHVVCTTNEDDTKIDNALKRNGRLFASIDFKGISRERAIQFFKRELGENHTHSLFREEVPESLEDFNLLSDLYKELKEVKSEDESPS